MNDRFAHHHRRGGLEGDLLVRLFDVGLLRELREKIGGEGDLTRSGESDLFQRSTIRLTTSTGGKG